MLQCQDSGLKRSSLLGSGKLNVLNKYSKVVFEFFHKSMSKLKLFNSVSEMAQSLQRRLITSSSLSLMVSRMCLMFIWKAACVLESFPTEVGCCPAAMYRSLAHPKAIEHAFIFVPFQRGLAEENGVTLVLVRWASRHQNGAGADWLPVCQSSANLSQPHGVWLYLVLVIQPNLHPNHKPAFPSESRTIGNLFWQKSNPNHKNPGPLWPPLRNHHHPSSPLGLATSKTFVHEA